MSNVPTNEELAGMEIFPGGPTFGQAGETMGIPPAEMGLQPSPTSASGAAAGGRRAGETELDYLNRLDREAEDERQRLDREQSQRQFDETVGQQRENAFSIVNQFLQKAGLVGLDREIRQLLSEGIEDTNAILFRLRDTTQFKTRFKANEARIKAGLPELDPATYIGLEQSYRQVMQANGLPTGFYDQQSDFEKWIEGDVSSQELQARIEDGYQRAKNADPQVREQLQRLYGVNEAGLAAYFLDPERTRPLMAADYKRQVQAAEIAARGQEQGGLTLSQQEAEMLLSRGVTQEEAQRQFSQRAALGGLYQAMGGEQALSREQELGAVFGYNVEAEQALERRRRQRVAEFEGGGGFARTTGATSGTIETGLGTAQ